jgi:uncharacterized membrane protein
MISAIMDFAFKLLVIIVSSTLTVFLIVAIVAGVHFVKLLKSFRRIADKAEKLATSAEAVGDFFKKSAGPAAFGKFVANIADTVIQHKHNKEK